MRLKVFSIRDAKSELFNTPFLKRSMGEGERDFQTIVNDNQSIVFKYPEDYDLYYLGEFDDNSGKYMTLETPQHLAKAIQFREQTHSVKQ